jgi:hypothetical protein
MNKENFTIENDDGFAEKCRLALEKSYGVQIPVPKNIVKSS